MPFFERAKDITIHGTSQFVDGGQTNHYYGQAHGNSGQGIPTQREHSEIHNAPHTRPLAVGRNATVGPDTNLNAMLLESQDNDDPRPQHQSQGYLQETKSEPTGINLPPIQDQSTYPRNASPQPPPQPSQTLPQADHHTAAQNNASLGAFPPASWSASSLAESIFDTSTQGVVQPTQTTFHPLLAASVPLETLASQEIGSISGPLAQGLQPMQTTSVPLLTTSTPLEAPIPQAIGSSPLAQGPQPTQTTFVPPLTTSTPLEVPTSQQRPQPTQTTSPPPLVTSAPLEVPTSQQRPQPALTASAPLPAASVTPEVPTSHGQSHVPKPAVFEFSEPQFTYGATFQYASQERIKKKRNYFWRMFRCIFCL